MSAAKKPKGNWPARLTLETWCASETTLEIYLLTHRCDWPPALLSHVVGFKAAKDAFDDACGSEVFGPQWTDDAFLEPGILLDIDVVNALRTVIRRGETFATLRAAQVATDAAVAYYRGKLSTLPGGAA